MLEQEMEGPRVAMTSTGKPGGGLGQDQAVRTIVSNHSSFIHLLSTYFKPQALDAGGVGVGRGSHCPAGSRESVTNTTVQALKTK